ncbi:hypothetical protein MUP35_04370 [Patescibacteria group bacterium]|nr:hypothetical protein [Patescibacteria group bacterium]
MSSNKTNKYLDKVLDDDPKTEVTIGLTGRVTEFLNAKQDVLAHIYAFAGFREIMEVMISAEIRQAVIHLTDIELFRVKQGKIIALKELLSLSKKAYDKINTKPNAIQK